MRRGFTLHHNGPVARCVGQPHTRCVSFWEAIKRIHKAKWPNFPNTAYSFGMCPHGVRFTGCGWDGRQVANGIDVVGINDGTDSEWYTVLSFIGGGYTDENGVWVPEEKVTTEMLAGLQQLVDEGRDTGRCGLRVLPHNAFKFKACPGPTLVQAARAWDNQPFPAEPAPLLEEDDDMFLFSGPNTPVFFCDGGVAVGLNEASDMQTFTDNKIKHLKLDADTFDKFRQRFPGA